MAQRHALHVERTAEKAFMLSLQSFLVTGGWGGEQVLDLEAKDVEECFRATVLEIR